MFVTVCWEESEIVTAVMSCTGASVKRVVYDSTLEARRFWPRLWMQQSLRPVSVSIHVLSLPASHSRDSKGWGIAAGASVPCLVCAPLPSIHLQTRVGPMPSGIRLVRRHVPIRPPRISPRRVGIRQGRPVVGVGVRPGVGNLLAGASQQGSLSS